MLPTGATLVIQPRGRERERIREEKEEEKEEDGEKVHTQNTDLLILKVNYYRSPGLLHRSLLSLQERRRQELARLSCTGLDMSC